MRHKENHMRHKENHMRLHVCISRHLRLGDRPWSDRVGYGEPPRTRNLWTSPYLGGDFWSRPRLTGSWGGLRDELGKKGVVLDVDLLQTLQGVASGGE